MAPNRPTSLAADLEQATKQSYAAMSWSEQGEAIRRLNGRILAHVAALIESGNVDDQALGMLARSSSIAKSWAAAEEQEPTKPLTREELERIRDKK